jgi:hypothetical protein
VLYAFNATNLALQLYNSSLLGARDQFGAGNKYITPTIASARVYVGTTNDIGVFGLLDESTLTPLQVWRNTNFGNPSSVGAGADGYDPSGDGVPNLVKYALGFDPNTFVAESQLPSANIETNGTQGFLTMTVNRTTDPSDVTPMVEVSSDLINWFSGGTNTVTLTNTPTQLIVQDAVPVSDTVSRFIRFSVTGP